MPGWSWSVCENPLPHWGKLASVLRAGGWLVLEDGDGLLFNAEPRRRPSRRSPGPGTRRARRSLSGSYASGTGAVVFALPGSGLLT